MWIRMEMPAVIVMMISLLVAALSCLSTATAALQLTYLGDFCTHDPMCSAMHNRTINVGKVRTAPRSG